MPVTGQPRFDCIGREGVCSFILHHGEYFLGSFLLITTKDIGHEYGAISLTEKQRNSSILQCASIVFRKLPSCHEIDTLKSLFNHLSFSLRQEWYILIIFTYPRRNSRPLPIFVSYCRRIPSRKLMAAEQTLCCIPKVTYAILIKPPVCH